MAEMENSLADGFVALMNQLHMKFDETFCNAYALDIILAEEHLVNVLQLGTSSSTRSSFTKSLSAYNKIQLKSSTGCGRCRTELRAKCHECHEYLCLDCVKIHEIETAKDPVKHLIEHFPLPVGSSRSTTPDSNSGSSQRSNSMEINRTVASTVNFPNSLSGIPEKMLDKVQLTCFIHSQACNYVCISDTCKVFICSGCIATDHETHAFIGISKFAMHCVDWIKTNLSNGLIGIKKIRAKSQQALEFQMSLEYDCMQLIQSIEDRLFQTGAIPRKIFNFYMGIIQKLKCEKFETIYAQREELNSIYTAFCDICVNLDTLANNATHMDLILIAKSFLQCQYKLEKLREQFRGINLKKWSIFLRLPPSSQTLIGDVFCEEVKSNISDLLSNILCEDDLNIDAHIFTLPTKQLYNPAADIPSPPNQMPTFAQIVSIHENVDSPKNPSPPVPVRISQKNESGTQNINPNLEPEATPERKMPSKSTDSKLQRESKRNRDLKRCRTTSFDHDQNCLERKVLWKSFYHSSNESSSFEPEIVLSFAREGQNIGEVWRPWGICVDNVGNIVVADRRNNRIQIFDSKGEFLYFFGKPGQQDAEFNLPAGICVDSNDRYIVVDKDNHRVQIFTNCGRFLLKFGMKGSGIGQFLYPWDVAVNSTNEIVVSDSKNRRIQKFDADGKFMLIVSIPSTVCGSSPRGLSFSPTGEMYVSDFDNHMIHVVDLKSGKVNTSVGGEGMGLFGLTRPSGLAISKSGILAVADSKNQRVLFMNESLHIKWNLLLSDLQGIGLSSKDRISNVAFITNEKLLCLVELAPDDKKTPSSSKLFLFVVTIPDLK